ncbi:MAG: hypothetical protein M9918_21450 [Anaerolineae bacterium]|nr:hypothetical protein [Anaerolineae bacterium]MCO5195565.1 hypothetical protein [Anaerolineae bacterium]
MTFGTCQSPLLPVRLQSQLLINSSVGKPMLKYKAIILLIAIMLVGGCSTATEPETVEVTRIVTVKETVEVPVNVEVTRIVEVPVQVVQEVEVDRIIEVEVTRIVEIEVTVEVTPEPTDKPEPTPTVKTQTIVVTAPPPSSNVKADLLATMMLMRNQVQEYGGIIDWAVSNPFGYVDCQKVVDLNATITNAPTYDISTSEEVVRNAQAAMQNAITLFVDGTKDLTENCRQWLVHRDPNTRIPFQQWGVARDRVDATVNALQPAILSIGGS